MLYNLRKKEYLDIEKEICKYNDKRSILLESLKIIQKSRGWVSYESMLSISFFLKIPISLIKEIATFYSNIYMNPINKYIIKYCDSVVCYIKGYKNIEIFLKKKIKN